MGDENKAKKVVDRMFNNDPFSLWLGIKRVRDGAGTSVLQLTVRKEMLNGFEFAHGGIAYSLADSALAFASNGHGRKAMSVETSISHLVKVVEGDILTAMAQEKSHGNRIRVYTVTVTNQKGQTVALFKGTVYVSEKEWFPENEG